MILRELIKMYLIYSRGRGIKNYVISDKGYLRFFEDGSLVLGFGDGKDHSFVDLKDMLNSRIFLNNEDMVKELNEAAIRWARQVNEALIKGIKQ